MLGPDTVSFMITSLPSLTPSHRVAHCLVCCVAVPAPVHTPVNRHLLLLLCFLHPLTPVLAVREEDVEGDEVQRWMRRSAGAMQTLVERALQADNCLLLHLHSTMPTTGSLLPPKRPADHPDHLMQRFATVNQRIRGGSGHRFSRHPDPAHDVKKRSTSSG